MTHILTDILEASHKSGKWRLCWQCCGVCCCARRSKQMHNADELQVEQSLPMQTIVERIFCSRIIDILALLFKPLRDSSLFRYFFYHSSSDSDHFLCTQQECNSQPRKVSLEWGFTGYELLIRFPALRILVCSYLCRYWCKIPRVISLDLVSTQHKCPCTSCDQRRKEDGISKLMMAKSGLRAHCRSSSTSGL